MNKWLLPIIIIFSLSFVNTAFSTEEQEKIYLTQIINNLNALQPLIIAANKEQSKNTRIQFHYMKYKDSDGYWHNGLLEDIHAIKKGIEEKLTTVAIEPRTIKPIQGDYFVMDTAKSNQ